MENKYFTPKLEDIHVGYECEEIAVDFSKIIDIFLPEGSTVQDYREAWGKLKCTDKYDSIPYSLTAKDIVDFTEYNGTSFAPDFKGRPIEMYIRTPYLTDKQIEAEGWIQESPSPNGYLYYFTKVVGGNGEYNKWGHYEGTRYFLKYYKNNKWLAPLEISQLIPEIPDERGSREYRSDPLKFDCKDINTFRYICKLLRINEKATNNSTSPE